MRRLVSIVFPLLVLLAGDVASARSYGSIQFSPCTLASPGLASTVSAQCAKVPAPLDYSRPAGPRIELAVAWVPADAKGPAPDPVFMLAGGPGQSARDAFASIEPAFRDVLRKRNVILVDQRGAGGSHPLVCEQPDPTEMQSAGVVQYRESARRCLAGLNVDSRFFTTSEAVRDLDLVRGLLGAEQLNLVGMSYGTRVALEYLRRFPERTRTVTLDGVVPPQLALGADHARNLENAVDLYFHSFGKPRAALDDLRASLRDSPRQVAYRDPLTGAVREGLLDADRVAGVARLYAYSPQLAALLPLALAEAADQRPEALMAQAAMIESLIGEQISLGLQLAVACAEDVDLLRPNPADEGTLLGNAFVESMRAMCEVWPRGERPRDFHEPVRSDVPVLALSGEFDPVTPPRYGDQVIETLSRGRHLVARGQGHNVMIVGCAPRLIAKFIASADAKGLDAGCLDQLIYTPPFTGTYGWEP